MKGQQQIPDSAEMRLVLAAVAMHGLLSNSHPSPVLNASSLADNAFDIADKFLAKALEGLPK